MSLTISIPDWGVWLISVLLLLNMALNLWHGVIVRQYTRLMEQR